MRDSSLYLREAIITAHNPHLLLPPFGSEITTLPPVIGLSDAAITGSCVRATRPLARAVKSRLIDNTYLFIPP